MIKLDEMGAAPLGECPPLLGCLVERQSRMPVRHESHRDSDCDGASSPQNGYQSFNESAPDSSAGHPAGFSIFQIKALILKLVSRCYNAGYEYAPQRHHQSEREGDDCHVLERPYEAPGLRMRNLDTSRLIGDG